MAKIQPFKVGLVFRHTGKVKTSSCRLLLKVAFILSKQVTLAFFRST